MISRCAIYFQCADCSSDMTVAGSTQKIEAQNKKYYVGPIFAIFFLTTYFTPLLFNHSKLTFLNYVILASANNCTVW